MLYYHGTTRRVAEAIQHEGLRPHRETAYEITTEFGDNFRELPGEKDQVVYLTKHRDEAESFAHFRARYEMAQPGEAVSVPMFPVQYKAYESASCNCIEEPVLIAFDIPEELEHKFTADIQDKRAKVCACVIPPQYIKSVETATNMPSPDDEDPDEDPMESLMEELDVLAAIQQRNDL